MAAVSMAAAATMVAAATMEMKDMKAAAQNDGRAAMVEGCSGDDGRRVVKLRQTIAAVMTMAAMTAAAAMMGSGRDDGGSDDGGSNSCVCQRRKQPAKILLRALEKLWQQRGGGDDGVSSDNADDRCEGSGKKRWQRQQ